MVSYCPKCATKVLTTDARFCTSCGAKFTAATDAQPASASAQDPKSRPPVSTFVLVLLVVLLLGYVAAESSFAFQGKPPDKQAGPGLIFWSAVVFYALFRRWQKKGWMGAVVGLMFAFGFLVFVNAVAARHNRSDTYTLMRSPLFTAIQKFDPAAFQRMQALFEAVEKDSSATHEAKVNKVQALVTPILLRAVRQTSNEALVRYTEVRVATLEEVRRASAGDCVALITGESKGELAVRVRAYQSNANREANTAAMSFVIESAANHPGHFELSERTKSDLLSQLESKLAERELSTSYILGDARTGTAEQQCQSGIQLFRETLKLEEPARSGFLRYLMTG